MDKECVFNELSLFDFDVYVHDRTALMEKLANLRGLVGATHVSMWSGVKNPQTEIGSLFDKLKTRSRNSAQLERDRWRNVYRFFEKAADFDEEPGESACIDGKLADGLPKHPAHGLARACRMHALALSLHTANRWLVPRIRIIDDSGENSARHAADAEQLASHHDWGPLTEVQRLRIKLATSATQHFDASKYSKHMYGATEDQRSAKARRPDGAGQFIVERRGQRITAEHIRQWEQDVLNRVHAADANDSRLIVKYRSADHYHIFCDLGEIIGYLGGSGEPTSWMRVEWTVGSVHSHPRRP